MFIQGKPWTHFLELHQQIFWYQFNLEATHPYQSRPYEWILDMSPVWYFVEYLPNNRRADIYNTGNPFVFWGGLIAVLATILMVPILLITNIRRRWNSKLLSPVLSPLKASQNKQFSLSIILVAYLLCWVPWLFSPRIMFSYHYAPAVPLMTILIAYWSNLEWQWSENQSTEIVKTVRFTLIFLLLVTVGFFILWYPHWVAIPVRTTLKDALYLVMPTWR
jgi:dolichyl-phosphate-mannose--protein O-mannosyl transferase